MEEEEKKTTSRSSRNQMQVCNREAKCKKISHKTTSQSVFVTSIPVHSKNNMALASHTHPGNSRAMPDEGLFVWSRALSIIGGDVLAIQLLFEPSIWFPFVLFYCIHLDALHSRFARFSLFSSLLPHSLLSSNILLSPPY